MSKTSFRVVLETPVPPHSTPETRFGCALIGRDSLSLHAAFSVL